MILSLNGLPRNSGFQSLTGRTDSGYAQLNRLVEDLWGSAHYQKAPTVTLKTIKKDGDKETEIITPVELESR